MNYFFSIKETLAQWQLVFFITALIYFCGNGWFCRFLSTDVQPWAQVALDGEDGEEEQREDNE